MYATHANTIVPSDNACLIHSRMLHVQKLSSYLLLTKSSIADQEQCRLSLHQSTLLVSRTHLTYHPFHFFKTESEVPFRDHHQLPRCVSMENLSLWKSKKSQWAEIYTASCMAYLCALEKNGRESTYLVIVNMRVDTSTVRSFLIE